jgi:hypothetical protein
MPSPDNFYKRLHEFSGFVCGTETSAVENNRFWIKGIRLQDNFIAIELLGEDGECEFAIGLSDLVDGFEDFIVYSHPEDACEYKETTLSALRKAASRIESMQCGQFFNKHVDNSDKVS